MRFIRPLACLLALVALAAPAWAQPDRPGRGQRSRQLEPEQAKAAWTWQAKVAGQGLGLEEAAIEKVTEVYVATRASVNAAARKARAARRDARDRGADATDNDAGGPPDRERAREGGRRERGGMRRPGGVDPAVIEEARASMEKSFQAFLTPEQSGKAAKTLGSFSPRWDQMVHVVSGFELEAGQTAAALAPVQAFMTELARVRESGDWQSMREEMMAAREELMDALGKVLSAEQLETFREKTSRRRGRRGDSGRPGGIPPEGI